MTARRWAAALLVLAAVVVWVFDRHYRFFDMAIYQGAVRWWLDGGELYGYRAPVQGGLGFTYPPFAALVLIPLALLPLDVAGWLIAVAGVAGFAAGLGALTGVRRTTLLALLVVPALATEPIRQTLGLGQVNLLLFALIVLDLAVLNRRGSRWAGVGVGLAAAIKLTPALFIVHLVLTRQWRAAATAAGTFAGLTAAAGMLAPRETVAYFGNLLWQTGRVGAPDAIANQSLTGMLARLDVNSASWLSLSTVVLVVGLVRARRAAVRGDEVCALVLVGLTANLVTPVAWTHHLVFLPVALLVLARRSRGLAVPAYAVCVLSPIWWMPERALTANAFALLTLMMVAWLPISSASSPSATARPGIRQVTVISTSPRAVLGSTR